MSVVSRMLFYQPLCSHSPSLPLPFCVYNYSPALHDRAVLCAGKMIIKSLPEIARWKYKITQEAGTEGASAEQDPHPPPLVPKSSILSLEPTPSIPGTQILHS